MAVHKLQKRLVLSRPRFACSARSPSRRLASFSRRPLVALEPPPTASTSSPRHTLPTPPSARSLSTDKEDRTLRGGASAALPRFGPPSKGGFAQVAHNLSNRFADGQRQRGRPTRATQQQQQQQPQQPLQPRQQSPYASSNGAPAARTPASTLGGSDVDPSILRALATRRHYRVGDVYTPYDLEPRPREAHRVAPRAPRRDVFDALGVDPLEDYKNPALLAEFMTTMGRLRKRTETGLRPVNQRRLSKAVRRATGMGLMPTVRPHPELMRRETPWQYQ